MEKEEQPNKKLRQRSFTLRFALFGFAACVIVPGLALALVGLTINVSKMDWLVDQVYSVVGRIVEDGGVRIDAPDTASRISAIVRNDDHHEMETWVVDAAGQIYSQTLGGEFPLVPSDYTSKTKPAAFKVYSKSVGNNSIIVRPVFGDGKFWIVLRLPYKNSRMERVVNMIAIFTGLVSLLITSMTAALVVIYFRTQASKVRAVLGDLKKGRLDSRFQINRIDEVSSLMLGFNEMADEIERLVNEVRKGEAERTELLQFLAHDIRTPLTSLRLISDELEEGKASLKTKKNVTLLNQELVFFEKLTEDLFFLAKIKDQTVTNAFNPIDLPNIVRSEVERAERLAKTGKKKIYVTGKTDGVVFGDENLLRRMIRNALGNAIKFAKKEVTIEITAQNESLTLAFQDDGPGFAQEKLSDFGLRKPLRYRAGVEKDAAISLGLGSVILSQIVNTHGGQVKVSNRTNASQKIYGALLQIQLPLAKQNAQKLRRAA